MKRGPMQVLVVEGHPTIARQVVAFLEGVGWEADHAASGALAIELATRAAYDLVLLDLNLRDIDAFNAGLPIGRTTRDIDANEAIWAFFTRHSC